MRRNPRKQNAPRLPDDIEFRQVPGYSMYLVSIDGRFWTTAIDGEPALMTLSKRTSNKRREKSFGRLRIRLSHAGRIVMLDAASLACEAWHGPRPEGGVVGFVDGNMHNLAAGNLGWRMPDVRVSDADFVRAWQSSFSVAEAAEKCGGISVQVAYSRSRQLRDRGVRLKEISRSKDSADDLNSLIDELDE